MKYRTTVTFIINTRRYKQPCETEDDARQLVKDIMVGKEDLPEEVEIKIEKVNSLERQLT